MGVDQKGRCLSKDRLYIHGFTNFTDDDGRVLGGEGGKRKDDGRLLAEFSK